MTCGITIRDRLAERGGHSLEAGHAPADDAEAVDHRRMAVDANHRVGINERARARLFGAHDARQVFEIDLVTDAAAGGNYAQPPEGVVAPAQKPVTLRIPLVFEGCVAAERVGARGVVGDDRMIDDEVDRNHRIDAFGIASEPQHCVAHRRQVADQRNAGGVVHHDANRPEMDLAAGPGPLEPRLQRRNVIRASVPAARWRSTFSSTTLSVYGRRATPGIPSFAAARGCGTDTCERRRELGQRARTVGCWRIFLRWSMAG
jgi:hypothetical protein